MKNAWPSENKGERVRTGAVKRVVNVSVYSAYLMKFRLLSTGAPVHLSFHKGEYTHIVGIYQGGLFCLHNVTFF